MMPIMLTTEQLAERWGLRPVTLKKWRVNGLGPHFVKLGDAENSSVRYRKEDVLAYEAKHMNFRRGVDAEVLPTESAPSDPE